MNHASGAVTPLDPEVAQVGDADGVMVENLATSTDLGFHAACRSIK
jgi:hypothetical protein